MEYREELRHRYKELTLIDYCPDTMVNAVLYYEINRCKELGIQTEVRMQEFRNGNIHDFFSLLYNLFDNAIEACQKLKPEKKRFIRFRLYEEETFLNLYMENTYQDILLSKGRIITNKKNKILHEVGLSF